MIDNFAAIVALALALALPVLVWSVTRPRSVSTGDQARLFTEIFVVAVAALVLTRFAVIPFLRWLDVMLF